MHTTVLFDLDGTLIDQFTAIHKSVNHVRSRLGLEPAGYESVKHAVGGSVKLTLERLFQGNDLETTLPLFKEHFEQIMMDDVFVLPGILNLLKHLKKQAIQMGVLTNKIGPHARATLDHLGLSPYFESVVGVGDTDSRKPDPKFTQYILDQMRADLSKTCLIGDSPFDWQTGVEAGIPVYLVATGTHDTEALKSETQSDFIYADLCALAKAQFNLDLNAYDSYE
tara:strand:+ start:130 stop:801 length:672 start_codon:yes stop_codon:yes gene_type:complete